MLQGGDPQHTPRGVHDVLDHSRMQRRVAVARTGVDSANQFHARVRVCRVRGGSGEAARRPELRHQAAAVQPAGEHPAVQGLRGALL